MEKSIAVSIGHNPPRDYGFQKKGKAEYFYNASVAIELQKELYENEYIVYYPHGSLKTKVDMINHLFKPEIAVEIHHNSNSRKMEKGAEIIYHPTSIQGKILAEKILKEMEYRGFETGGIFKGYYRYDKTKGYFYFTSKTNMPAVIIECAYMTNADDFAVMNEIDYFRKMAHAIYRGIENYVED